MADYSEYKDEELTGFLKQGEAAAFKEIYQRYNTLLYLYAYRKLRDKEEAKDVVQEVFIALWDSHPNFELKTFLSGYLYKSVLNRVLNVFKHKAIVRNYAEINEVYVDVDSTETDFLIREKDIATIIEREIASMPPKMREIYELKTKSYLSTKAIAEQLGISDLTVSTQLKRAAKHLKTRLGLVLYLLHLLNT